MEVKNGPHRCPTCNLSFSRISHLRRHTRLHDQKGGYQCLCGNTFSRNDGISRHLRSCVVARQDATMLEEFESVVSRKQTREKRACDNCARMKMKCTSQVPCHHCSRKNLACLYTRNGYVDPYERFRVNAETIIQQQSEGIHDKVVTQPDPPQATSDLSLSDQHGPDLEELSFQGLENYGFSLPETDIHIIPSPLFSVLSVDDWFCNDYVLANLDSASFLGMPLAPALSTDISLDIPFPSTAEPRHSQQGDLLNANNWIHTHCENTRATPQSSLASENIGLTVQQLDPLEARCDEFRDLLHNAIPSIDGDDVRKYVTRDIVYRCGKLFGTHLSRNIPILHLPTFSLLKAPALLALTVVLGGGCYDTSLMPASVIIKFSKALLLLIERRTHEIYMQAPHLSTIQASFIACCILLCSRHNEARRFASVHFSRCISMADRLGVFAKAKMTDGVNITMDSFDWLGWVEEESHRRVACAIFCLDMAFCVFLGKPPSFSVFSFHVQMPCYERCWEAHDPAKCFQYLRESPTTSDVSSYLYKLYRCRGEEPLNFKVSHYGLFTLVLALHASLLRIIQEEPEPHPSPYLSQRLFQLVDPLAVLQRQITGESVAILADTLIELYGSATMKECNRAFNACRRVWNQVCVSNLEGQPCTSFFTDPLPFWYLAKMYQALYLCDDFIEGNTVFELPMKRGRHDPWEIEIHHTIIAWLNYFRDKVSLEDTEGMQPDASTSTDSILGNVFGISVLMKP